MRDDTMVTNLNLARQHYLMVFWYVFWICESKYYIKNKDLSKPRLKSIVIYSIVYENRKKKQDKHNH